jgi:hypothetical protein
MWPGKSVIEACVEGRREPEPFSGVIHISGRGEVLFEAG